MAVELFRVTDPNNILGSVHVSETETGRVQFSFYLV